MKKAKTSVISQTCLKVYFFQEDLFPPVALPSEWLFQFSLRDFLPGSFGAGAEGGGKYKSIDAQLSCEFLSSASLHYSQWTMPQGPIRLFACLMGSHRWIDSTVSLILVFQFLSFASDNNSFLFL